jgi:hypothetical protein
MRTLALVLLWMLLANAQAGETLFGSNADVRTALYFRTSDAAAQKLLPDGWEPSSIPAGPFKGSNVVLVLIDSIWSADAAGKPVAPFRGSALAVLAKKKGTEATVIMIASGITTRDGAPGAYGVYAPGLVAIERKVSIGADGKSSADEHWILRADDGNSTELQIQYGRGETTQSKVESKNYSGARPDFFRIYRWDQVADMVKSAPTGVDRVTKYSLKATGSRWGALFDGSEQLVGVVSLPSYSRAIFLPDS